MVKEERNVGKMAESTTITANESISNGGNGNSDESFMIADKGKGKQVFFYEDKEYRNSTMFDNLNMLRKNRQFCDVILQVYLFFSREPFIMMPVSTTILITT